MKHPVVVIGASAGGMAALSKLAASLPSDFPAAVFVAQHMAADQKGDALVNTLARAGPLTCGLARDGEPIKSGHIFVAPPDHHLLLSRSQVVVSKGARENRSRPAIDPLFRSAAVAFRGKVIAVLLTGNLDDGTAGLIAVKRCGGVTVIQDPRDAQYPDMPQHAAEDADETHLTGRSERSGRTGFCSGPFFPDLAGLPVLSSIGSDRGGFAVSGVGRVVRFRKGRVRLVRLRSAETNETR